MKTNSNYNPINFDKSSERAILRASLEKDIESLADVYHSANVDREGCRQTYLKKVWQYYTEAYFSSRDKGLEFAEKYDAECIETASNCLERYNGEGNFMNYLNFSIKKATTIDSLTKSLYVKNGQSTYDREVIYESEFTGSNEEDEGSLCFIEDYSESPDFINGKLNALDILSVFDRVYMTKQARAKSYISLYLTNELYESFITRDVESRTLKKYHFFDSRFFDECCRRNRSFKSNELASMAGMAPSNFNRAITTFKCKVKEELIKSNYDIAS